jgi:hypothetical protein
MKTLSRLSLPAIACGAAVLLTLAGCDTFDSRAKEKSATYDSLNSNTQQRLEKGKINVGDTPDMVYIALGNPDEKRERSTTNNEQDIWIYKTYVEEYAGTVWGGYHRVIGPGFGGRGYIIYREPISQDLYRDHVDEIIRVTFSAGKVTAVEQVKR